jgi:predicted nucleic acid-binding Zn ribbon protein
VSPEQEGTERDVTQTTPSSTGGGGQPPDAVDNNTGLPAGTSRDLARAALADARKMRRAGPPAGRDERRRAAIRQANLARRGGYSGADADERDPQRLGDVLSALLAERGWATPVTEARLFADWAGLVGADIATHCEPVSLRDGELRVAAQSTAWATQLRLMASSILAALRAELGPDVVRRLQVTGPVGPTWKHGVRSIHGGRGPRDTYG